MAYVDRKMEPKAKRAYIKGEIERLKKQIEDLEQEVRVYKNELNHCP